MTRPALPGLLRKVGRALLRPQMLSFLPAMILAGYWYGGEGVLALFAVTFPMILLVIGLFESNDPVEAVGTSSGLSSEAALVAALDSALSSERGTSYSAICFCLSVDDMTGIASRHGVPAADLVRLRIVERLLGALRGGDVVARLKDDRFALLIADVRGSNVDAGLGMAERLQAAIGEPINLGGQPLYVTSSVGFCLARRSPHPTGEAMLDATKTALVQAQRAGAGSVRVYSATMTQLSASSEGLASELNRAFDEGEIRGWFQPQLSTDTGEVTGFETLARWIHPTRGLLPPSEFLPVIEEAGQMSRLGETMLFHGLSALRGWDKAGERVPRVSLNLTSVELADPRLPDRISWELDRFDLTPDRLVIEVLETVVASMDDDAITTNLSRLSGMGCMIDLDDFGTGQAAIGNIRRFCVNRIKIDRSFVVRVDEDRSQQKMVTAILSLAAQLDLETVAEGVETMGEHTMVAQLGCGHVQGFGIARPMPFEDTQVWLARHNEKLSHTPKITGTSR